MDQPTAHSLTLQANSIIANMSTTKRARYAALIALEHSLAGRVSEAQHWIGRSYAVQRQAHDFRRMVDHNHIGS